MILDLRKEYLENEANLDGAPVDDAFLRLRLGGGLEGLPKVDVWALPASFNEIEGVRLMEPL